MPVVQIDHFLHRDKVKARQYFGDIHQAFRQPPDLAKVADIPRRKQQGLLAVLVRHLSIQLVYQPFEITDYSGPLRLGNISEVIILQHVVSPIVPNPIMRPAILGHNIADFGGSA